MKKKTFTRWLAGILTATMVVGSLGITAGAIPMDGNSDSNLDAQARLDAITQIYTKNLVPKDTTYAPKVEKCDNADEILGGKVLPTAWDTISILPECRKQKPWGICWSFAATGITEIATINAGLADKSVDFSEWFQAYITNNSTGKYTNGDIVEYEKKTVSYPSYGGSANNGIASMMNWYGAVTEADEPYDSDEKHAEENTPNELNSTDEMARNAIHVQGYRYYDLADTELVKNAIMESGAVTVGYNSSAGDYKIVDRNGKEEIIYYSGSAGKKGSANHDVMIVGWDDSFSKELLATVDGEVPENDGAWLIRNSWGSDWGPMNGYFWISYDEITMEDYVVQVLVDSKDNYDHNYQYDMPYVRANYSNMDEIKFANVFNISRNKGGSEEIDAVAFYCMNEGAEYAIQLYKFVNETEFNGNPEDGEPLYAQPICGKIIAQGYYTIPVPSVVVDEGVTIIPVITIKKDGDKVYCAQEAMSSERSLYEEEKVVAVKKTVTVANPRESYIYDEGKWMDYVDEVCIGDAEIYKGNLCIKLYTKDKEGTTDPIREFINRMYEILLGRTVEPEGLKNWYNSIKTGETSASQFVSAIANSQEFAEKEYSDASTVEKLYEAMLNRKADSDGLVGWTNVLANSKIINSVVYGMAGSKEFVELCKQYGIEVGNEESNNQRVLNSGIKAFVQRCYTEALGRDYDEDGLKDWCNRITSAENIKVAAKETATNGFFHSEEFMKKETSNDDYVKILYKTFLGREYDEEGFKDWTGRLGSGVSRDEVLAGFADSKEFADIMASYGIK